MSMYPQPGTRKPFELDYATSDKTLSKFFNVVYAWMAVGLAVTAAVADFVSQTDVGLRMVYGGGRGMAVIIALGMFAIAWGVQSAAMRINANVATGLFLLYSALMGALLSGIFVIYKMQTIGAAFLITGGTFAAMSVYGFVTKRDLSRIGSILVMCAFGLILASMVNLYLGSNGLSWIITYGVL